MKCLNLCVVLALHSVYIKISDRIYFWSLFISMKCNTFVRSLLLLYLLIFHWCIHKQLNRHFPLFCRDGGETKALVQRKRCEDHVDLNNSLKKYSVSVIFWVKVIATLALVLSQIERTDGRPNVHASKRTNERMYETYPLSK